MPTVTKARVKVTGRVQGVFFRQSTRDKARGLDLGGWVRNTDDGAVELEVWGPTDRVDELITWCHSGPPSARVTAVEVEWREDAEGPCEERPHFEITN